MGEQDFNELAGRIEALAWLTGALVAELEDAALIDGERLTACIRKTAQRRALPGALSPTVLQVSGRVLGELCASIDAARSHRRSAAC